MIVKISWNTTNNFDVYLRLVRATRQEGTFQPLKIEREVECRHLEIILEWKPFSVHVKILSFFPNLGSIFESLN